MQHAPAEAPAHVHVALYAQRALQMEYFVIIMAFVRALATRIVLNKQRIQEELDIWRIYHLIHYFEECGGKEVRVPRPKEVSLSKQYYAVETSVTRQVYRKREKMSKLTITRHSCPAHYVNFLEVLFSLYMT